VEGASARAARVWGSGDYDRIALTLAPMHDRLVAVLQPQAGQHWLDAATGSGQVAVRAGGAVAVVGVDVAPALLLQARRRSADAMRADFAVADVEHLPFRDEVFDVVASAVGIVFAPNQQRAARELARVCRRGGRLGLTSWCPDGGVGALFRLLQPFQTASAGACSHLEWGRPGHVLDLLGGAFDLTFEVADAPYSASSGQCAWEELAQAYGPMRELARSLPPGRREELRRAVVEFFEACREGGQVRHSREYLLVTGEKR
jgi:SAM-dependent methyltransferase